MDSKWIKCIYFVNKIWELYTRLHQPQDIVFR